MVADIADVPADWLKWAVVFLFAGVSLITAVYAAWFKKSAAPTNIPQPLTTQKAPEWATAAGVQNLARELDDLRREVHNQREIVRTEIQNMMTRITDAGEARAIAIHNRIEPLSHCLHQQSGQLAEISQLVHNLLSRVPASVRKG